MDTAKQQLIESIQGANNVLVTVSSNPSVDQLSAAIGLTLLLNKMGKHATAVYSGNTPSTIEFLQPEKTLEKNTDSLRDFIIALDKTKADKLRYKVEEDHVKIFITPYKTSISDKDLEFSQGDFNVDVVVALGVKEQRDLDQVITAHGRILHDATTIALTTGEQSTLGSINWIDSRSSSLCEMVVGITESLQKGGLDAQMATALMTGIVAETDRFSNAKTTPGAMSASATLMAAGANQQLVASKLQGPTIPVAINADQPVEPAESADGALQIDHILESDTAEEPASELPALDGAAPFGPFGMPQPVADDAVDDQPKSAIEGGSSIMLEPPSLGGKLTANTEPEYLDPSVDPLAGGDHDSPLLSHNAPVDTSVDEPLPDLQGIEELPGPTMTLPSEAGAPDFSTPPEPVVPIDDFSPKTLTDIEESVASPHVTDEFIETPAPMPAPEPTLPGSTELAQATEQFTNPEPTPAIEAEPSPELDIDKARQAVAAALAGDTSGPLPPLAAIGSQPLDLEIKQTGETGKLDHIDDQTGEPVFTMPENLVPPVTDLPADATAAPMGDAGAPPPVPPPMMPNLDVNTTLPDMPQDGPQAGPQNPFGLPPA